MNAFTAFLQWLGSVLKWWVSVMPWESGLRIRWGRHVKILGPGIHLRVPLMHTVFKQSTRLRRAEIPMQTITTKDNRTVTIGATLGYVIDDLLKLYQTLHHPEGTVTNLAQSAIADYVTTHRADECTPRRIEEGANEKLDFGRFGLSSSAVSITDFAFVRTFRLIQDTRWSSNMLDVSTPHGQAPA